MLKTISAWQNNVIFVYSFSHINSLTIFIFTPIDLDYKYLLYAYEKRFNPSINQNIIQAESLGPI